MKKTLTASILSLLFIDCTVVSLFIPSSLYRSSSSSLSHVSPRNTNDDTWNNNNNINYYNMNGRRLSYGRSRRRRTLVITSNSNRWDEEIEENSRRRASQGGGGSGIGETAAGAVLGGLLLGPFGAMFGASIGSNIGAKNSLNKARREEMEKLGITQDMLDSAREIGMALEKSNEGIKASQDSLETQQRFARRLDQDSSEIYDRAKQALDDGEEDKARTLLLERQNGLDKLKQVLKNCAEEKRRLEIMQGNVEALKTRAMEIDSLLRRTVGAKTFIDSSSSLSPGDDLGLSLSNSDPLLQKFKDLGID